jgi:hypothetical protein
MMKYLLVLLLVTLSSEKDQGDIEYTIATYSDEPFIDKKSGNFLDSLLGKSVFEYFCEHDINLLPQTVKERSSHNSPSERHFIEPLFINLANFGGVYGKRVWSLNANGPTHIRFRCGYYHKLFIISDNKYVELDRDSVSNEKLIFELLKNDFADDELTRMSGHFKYGMICSDFTFLPSFYIKKDDDILFDSRQSSGRP